MNAINEQRLSWRTQKKRKECHEKETEPNVKKCKKKSKGKEKEIIIKRKSISMIVLMVIPEFILQVVKVLKLWLIFLLSIIQDY